MVIERYLPVWGGAENQLRQLCPRLVDAGCEMTIVTRRWSRNMAVTELIDGVPVRRVGLPLKGWFGTAYFVLALFWYLLREGPRFEVIHSHGAAMLGALCRVAATLTGLRNMAKITTAGRISKLSGSLPGRLTLALFKRSDAIVCLSREIYDEISAINVTPDRIACIPNAVVVERFKPGSAESRRQWRHEHGFGEQDPVIVFSGRLVSRKGPDVLLEAWRHTVDRHPDAQLLLLGSGRDQPDSIEHRLRRTVEETSLRNVAFEGSVDAPEDYLAIADVFVLPSFREGFPNALLEAMAAGLATVSSRIGGVVDLVTDGETGLMFPTGDATALAKGLISLVEDPKRRREIGLKARSHVVENYSIETITQRYVCAYRSLVENRRVDEGIRYTASRKT